MPPDDEDLVGYLPVEYFRERDFSRSSRRIRDMPWGKRREQASVAPEELVFNTVTVDTISSPQKVVITNTGYDDLHISRIVVVGDYQVNSNVPPIMKPGQSAEIQVSFTPKRNGVTTGGVYVDTGNAAGTEFVRFRGVGAGGTGPGPNPDPDPDPEYGNAQLSAQSIAFGSINVGNQSAIRSVTLTNNGAEFLAINGISVTGEFTQTNDCGAGLAVGASCTINSRFLPVSAGAKAGSVHINHDGTGPSSVLLSGTGTQTVTPPVITVTDGVLTTSTSGNFELPSAPISLGSVEAGDVAEGKFYVTGSTDALLMDTLPADGNGWLFAYSVALNGTYSSVTSFEIAPNGRMYVRAQYIGEVPGTYNRVLTFGAGDLLKTVGISAVIEEEVVPPDPTGITKRIRIAGNQFYQATNNATDQGGTLPPEGGFRLKSVNWFGAEGTNYTPHGTWLRPWRSILTSIKSMGFNTIRLPFSGYLALNNPLIPNTAIDEVANPDLIGKRALPVIDMIIEWCRENDMYVVLDHHRRDAGAGADGSPISGSYTKANWISAWTVMATRYKDAVNVVGADVHNEPHDLDWTPWVTLVRDCGNAINAIAPDWIIFCEGIGHIGNDHYWWGGQLMGVETEPLVLTTPYRVAYSPHEYGQSVGSQQWQKKDGNNPANWPLNQAAIWDKFWGYIFYNNIAPIWIGEMGGFFGIGPDGSVKPYGTEETEWMTYLVRYLNFDKDTNGSVSGSEIPPAGHKGMSYAWWSYNPNSGDTGGLVKENWITPETHKLNIIAPILGDI